ncbi:MAG: MFS transporter [Candidatus Endonucleobacter bathymodioli]|uniref:MFS transporter n=1 Tax=Candidatus Endonucleibacter bathymodioli TaxID=539814 RepID=A0AA90NLQ1_9GAMM|nr:MFS transporter [Candidatus Endonucleobacter bathymodioli]
MLMPIKQTVTWWQSAQIYRHPKAITLLFLGFSAGLPLMLLFSSLSFWLREAEISRATIGFFSWIGLAYSVKWIWSPLIDKLSIPYLKPLLGRRRSWLIVSQAGIVAGLVGMAFTDPALNLEAMVMFAVVVAFCSATQDIVIDAYRIDAAEIELQAALAATYMIGYRIAMITAGAGTLAIAGFVAGNAEGYMSQAWMIAYLCMAVLMGVGIITTLIITEPPVNAKPAALEQRAVTWMMGDSHLPAPIIKLVGWCYISIVCPFADFIIRYRWQALLLLALISTYRISDIVLGIMANPFYVDLGFTKQEVAAISKIYGVVMTLVGAGFGGLLTMRFGIMPMLFIGALLSSLTNLFFVAMTYAGHDLLWLTLTISADNLSGGIATSAFIAWLSSLTNINYSATQYALFSSMMLLLPKFIAGFSGVMVDSIGYHDFFIMTALLGSPVLILIWLASKCFDYKTINKG